MISYRFVPISSQKGVLFFETPGRANQKQVYAFGGLWSKRYETDIQN